MAFNIVLYKKSLVAIALTFLFSTLKVYAQEPNYSLYQYTPFFTNPGSIGMVEDVRLMLNYRNQAIEVGENFMTSSISGYYPIYLGKHRLVFAANVLNDQVSDFVETNGGLLSVAYSVPLTSNSELSLGVQGGLFQRKTGSNFTTDDQFVNGGFDPNAVSGDALLNLRKSYPTLSTGLYYKLRDVQGREKAFLGGAIFNATQPNISFLDAADDNLPFSFRATAGYKIYHGLRLSVLPTARWVNQASNNFVDLGSRFGYELTNSTSKITKIELGLWYNSNDLGIFSMAYEQPNFTVGVSYDLALANDLATSQNGTFELAVSLRIKKKNEPHVPIQNGLIATEASPIGDLSQEEEITEEEKPKVIEEDSIVIEEERINIPEPISEKERIDIESLNMEFSHRDYWIRFEHASESNVISDNQQKVMDEVKDLLMVNPELNVLIVGHASSVGGIDFNQKISEKRAEEIGRILISNGIASSRISTVGRGESEPVEDNSTEYGASENRRVQIIFRLAN